jgi:acyl carrier protein
MSPETILSTINEVFVDVLDNETLVINRTTTAKDVEDWDSLNHIQLVVGIEKKFKVRFTTAEIRSWTTVGDMCDALFVKLKD